MRKIVWKARNIYKSMKKAANEEGSVLGWNMVFSHAVPFLSNVP